MNGILSNTPSGVLGQGFDPATMALLQMGLGLMQAGGPSPTPVPLGAAFGKSGMQALGGYQQGIEGMRKNAQTEALIGLENAKAELARSQAAKEARESDALASLLTGYGGQPSAPSAETGAVDRFFPQPQTDLGGIMPMGSIAPQPATPAAPAQRQSFTGPDPRLLIEAAARGARIDPILRVMEMNSPAKPGSVPFEAGGLTAAQYRDYQMRRDVGKRASVAEVSSREAVKAAQKDFPSDYDTAVASKDSLEKHSELLNILKTGDVNTGLAAELQTNIKRFQSKFLADKKAGKSVSDTQVIESLLGMDVFSMFKPMGLNSRNIDTPAERQFLLKVAAGEIPMEKDTLRRLVEVRQKAAQKSIVRWDERVLSGAAPVKDFLRSNGYPEDLVGRDTYERWVNVVTNHPENKKKMVTRKQAIDQLIKDGKIPRGYQ